MYQKILVPLDGSELAECVLPHVEAIGQDCRAEEVVLVRVTEPLHFREGYESRLSEEERAQIEKDSQNVAREYLEQVKSRLKLEGIKVKVEVLKGKVAESLAEYATNSGADLIIIATHGRSGVSRIVRGSIAERILHFACVPVMLVRPPACMPSF